MSGRVLGIGLRLRRATAAAVVAGVLGSTAAAPPPWQVPDRDHVTTAIGEFRVVRDEAPAGYRLVLNARTVIGNRQRITLAPLISGRSQAFVLAFLAASGSDCAGQFVAIRVRTPVVVSESFGTCGERFRAGVDGNRLEVTMPGVSPESARHAAPGPASETVFTYVDGALSERRIER